MAAIAGLRGTGDWGTDERPKNFRESILWMDPKGDTPMTALLGKVGSSPTNDPEYNWWVEPQTIVHLKLDGDFGTSDTLLTVTVDDPDASDLSTNWSSALHLVPGDILKAEPAADAAVYDYELMVVTGVHSATQFSVARAAFSTSADNLPANGSLLLIGNAFAEGTGTPGSASRQPVKFNNFTQIWKTLYEITGTADATEFRTGAAYQNEKKRKSFDHARAIEFSLLWGQPSESIDPINKKPIRTTAGIRYAIPSQNTTILENSWGLAKSASAGNNLIDAVSPVFDYSTRAGDERIALIGNGALNAINKAIVNGSGAGGVELSKGVAERAWGMNFRELMFPQGRLMLKTHPLLSRHPVYTYSMFILDFSIIKWRPLKGRDTKFMDDIQQKGEDVRRGMWQTEAGLMVDQGGMSLGYIGGFNATIA